MKIWALAVEDPSTGLRYPVRFFSTQKAAAAVYREDWRLGKLLDVDEHADGRGYRGYTRPVRILVDDTDWEWEP